MTPNTLVGRRVKVTLWDDLADLMPGGSVGLVKEVTGDGDDAELTVQFLGLRKLYIFTLNNVELMPSDYFEAVLFTAMHPTQQGDTIRLHRSPEAARLEVGIGRPIYRVLACLARDGRHMIPHFSSSPDFDPSWRTPVETHDDGSFTAQGPMPGWMLVERDEHTEVHL